jgi:hypothetical protein
MGSCLAKGCARNLASIHAILSCTTTTVSECPSQYARRRQSTDKQKLYETGMLLSPAIKNKKSTLTRTAQNQKHKSPRTSPGRVSSKKDKTAHHIPRECKYTPFSHPPRLASPRPLAGSCNTTSSRNTHTTSQLCTKKKKRVRLGNIARQPRLLAASSCLISS